MSLKKLELELAAAPSVYFEKLPYKQSSYYYPFLIVERPLKVNPTVKKVGFNMPYIEEESGVTTQGKLLNKITVTTVEFHTSNTQEDIDSVTTQGKLKGKIVVTDTIFFKKHKQEETDSVLTTGKLKGKVTLTDTLFYIKHKQEEDSSIETSGKLIGKITVRTQT